MQLIELTPSQEAPHRTAIHVGAGAVTRLAPLVRDAAMVLLVADRALVKTAMPARVQAILAESQRPVVASLLPSGDSAKTVGGAAALWEEWLENGAGRDAIVIAVGGGALSDVVGFAAASFMRGIPWIAVPTTVLAMADAAIGGKTAINMNAGKNLVGAIHHPRAVLCDLDALKTLSDESHADGFAEVIKAGVIGDAGLLDDIESGATAIRARDAATVEELLTRAIRVKADVVADDANESGRREILNFGHTVGHALEAAAGGALSHGRAVALGMIAEGALAVKLGRLPSDTPTRIAALCVAVGIDLTVPRDLSGEAMVAALAVDKKRRQGVLRVSLPSGLGQHDAQPSLDVDSADLLSGLSHIG